MKEKLIQELHEFIEKYGLDNLTQEKFIQTYHHDRRMIYRHFGSWRNFRQEAGIEGIACQEESDHSKDLIVEALKKKAQTLYDLCDLLQTYPAKVKQILEKLHTHPGFLHKKEGGIDLYQIISEGPIGPENQILKIKKTKFGLVSDTHLGSKFQQLTYLWDFYEYCQNQGVEIILHAGDMTDGNGKIYRGQQFEMFLHGFKEQQEYVIENYPKVEGVTTYVILGNHDDSWIKEADINLLEQIAKERKDIKYLGRLGAYIYFDKVKAYLIHPTGGAAYAQSYKAQKFIESFSSENKPQLFFIGHWHFALQGFVRNVYYILAGCFQAQTPYELVKGLHPAVGGWIVEFDLEKDGYSVKNIRTTFRPYYRVIKEDYRREKWV